MRDWELKDDLCRGWVLRCSDGGVRPIFPRYRGAFEAGERSPGRIRVNSLTTDAGGASARFRAPSFSRRNRSFGVSLEISPEIWGPAGSRRGWHFFAAGDIFLGLWTSLPATWLAQNSDGGPLPPPWTELWTFGTDHLWACRIAGRTGSDGSLESFISACVSTDIPLPGRCGGIVRDSATLDSGDPK